MIPSTPPILTGYQLAVVRRLAERPVWRIRGAWRFMGGERLRKDVVERLVEAGAIAHASDHRGAPTLVVTGEAHVLLNRREGFPRATPGASKPRRHALARPRPPYQPRAVPIVEPWWVD